MDRLLVKRMMILTNHPQTLRLIGVTIDKMSYKAWKRGEENIGNEEETDAIEDIP